MTGLGAAITTAMISEPSASQQSSVRKLNWGRWFVLVLMASGLGLFLVFGPSEQTIIRNSHLWRDDARSHLVLAVLIFFLAEIALIACSAPVGIWLTALAGFLFGTWLGTTVVSFGATFGAVLAFLSARYVFAGALRRAAETRPRLQQRLNAIDEGFRRQGAYFVILLRLMPAFPFFIVNLGLGLTSVRLRDYWWASQVGMLPITLVVANAGASLAEITSFREILSLRILLMLCLFPLVPLVLHHTLGRWLARNR